jgi:hypothetical protein
MRGHHSSYNSNIKKLRRFIYLMRVCRIVTYEHWVRSVDGIDDRAVCKLNYKRKKWDV